MSESEEQRALDLEDALDLIGSGAFQWFALMICGLANAADAVEILSIGLVLPVADDDLDLDANSKGVLASVVLVGMLLGGLLWGLLGDRIGRKWSLVTAVTLNAFFGLVSSMCRTWQGLAAVRFMAGVGVGGSVPVVFSHLAELLPQRQRGKFMVLLAAHWMVGSLYSASVGWLVIPTAGWRLFLALASLPAWACALLAATLLPESPRHLLVHGHTSESLQVLRWAASLNRTKFPANITLKLPPGASARAASSPTHRRLPLAQRLQAQVRIAGSTFWALLTPPLSGYTWPLIMAWVGLAGGWYATVLWIPQYFKMRCDRSGTCTEASVYSDAFFVALANLPGNIASMYLVEAWGRKRTTTACLLGACVAALLFAAAPAEGAWPLLAACTFNAISTGGWNCLDLLSAELYPTTVRSSGMGLLGAAGRLASALATFLAARLMQTASWLPLLMSAVLLAAGSAAMMTLPEPAGKPLQDVVSQDAGSGEGSEDAEAVAGGSGAAAAGSVQAEGERIRLLDAAASSPKWQSSSHRHRQS